MGFEYTDLDAVGSRVPNSRNEVQTCRQTLYGASFVIKRRDTSNRRERIVTLLREQGSVQIPALAELFGVSTQTLRKDLNFLDRKRICTRSTGGAILHAGAVSATEDAIDVKRTLQHRQAGRYADLGRGVRSARFRHHDPADCTAPQSEGFTGGRHKRCRHHERADHT